MKLRSILFTAVFFSLLAIQSGRSADAFEEVNDLIGKINLKIQAGKHSAPDFKDEIGQFDALMAEHKGEQTDGAAYILFQKARFFGQVLGDKTKSDELLKQLVKDFKGTGLAAKVEAGEAAEAKAREMKDVLAEGAPFPDFNEKDVSGDPISISAHKGKILLVDFWATWCPPCRAELPYIMITYKKFHDKGFDVLGISLDEDKTKLVEFTAAMRMPWPEFFDGQKFENKLAMKYGIQQIPASFLLDQDGKIIARDLHGEELEKAVADALAKIKSPATNGPAPTSL